jgi:hypothetical protein
MALDSSLFTLTFQRRSTDATKLDLIPFQLATTASIASSSASSSSTPLYTFSRAPSAHYEVQLTDFLTSVPLSSISSPSSHDKLRTIQLYNPTDSIVFEKKTMTFRQDWRWTWQNQEYLIRKDGKEFIVEAVRRPDPEIE